MFAEGVNGTQESYFRALRDVPSRWARWEGRERARAKRIGERVGAIRVIYAPSPRQINCSIPPFGAEELAAKENNVAAARSVAKRLKEERQAIAELVARLRVARELAGFSLNELETRTGIKKSSLSRLENSAAPNSTLLTLHRYAAAIGATLVPRIGNSVPHNPSAKLTAVR